MISQREVERKYSKLMNDVQTNKFYTEIDLSNSISLIIGKDNRIFYHQLAAAGLNDQTLQETTFLPPFLL